MDDPYLPQSPFLLSILEDKIAFSQDSPGLENLRTLIALTKDTDTANRDWAVLLLSELDLDTEQVRMALIDAATDPDLAVRSEAIRGLAKRDRGLALPFVQRALSAPAAGAPIFEAAELSADPVLIEDLRCFAEPSDNPYLDGLAQRALLACGGSMDLSSKDKDVGPG